MTARFRFIPAAILPLLACGIGDRACAASKAALLPEQVPYLNAKHRYVMGNGIAFAVGDGSGAWTILSGPGYLGSNPIQSETISLVIDGKETPLSLDMRRARETGIYYGVTSVGDLTVRLIDFGRIETKEMSASPWLGRMVEFENNSANVHDVGVKVAVKPLMGKGRTQGETSDSTGSPVGFFIKNDTSVEAAGWMGNNVMDRTTLFAFSEPGIVSVTSDNLVAQSAIHHLAANEHWDVTLFHGFESPTNLLSMAWNGDASLQQAIDSWQGWFRGVAPKFSLNRIKDQRARDLVEGGLAVIKANQSADGGFMANSTCYIECYPRDDALGLRGLATAGHFDELKKWLIWIDEKIPLWGHLADSYSGMPELKDGTLHLDYGNCNVEETAYYIMAARDYYNATKDLATLDRIRPTLAGSMDVQLQDAVRQNHRLDFQGDETEGCTADGTVPTDGTPLKEWGDKKSDYWSMTSVAMCASSLDFYIKYLELHGENPHKYKNSYTKTTMDLPEERKKLLAALERDYWRTDLAAFPGGFHDFARRKTDNAWADAHVVNFTLQPIYFGTPTGPARLKADVEAMATLFDPKTGFLQLFPPVNNGFDGHDLGYLLWGLVAINDPRKDEVYRALVNGPTADCWGSFTEGYSAAGVPNDHDLRTLETGVNISAIAKYWNLGAAK